MISLQDQILAKDLLHKELEKERLIRQHIEKERDAFSAAYEASIRHFEKLSKLKIQRK